MAFPDAITLAQQLAEVQRETADIRRLCRKQRKQLAEQFARLQAVRRAISYVQSSLDENRTELWESRLLLDLHSGRRLH